MAGGGLIWLGANEDLLPWSDITLRLLLYIDQWVCLPFTRRTSSLSQDFPDIPASGLYPLSAVHAADFFRLYRYFAN